MAILGVFAEDIDFTTKAPGFTLSTSVGTAYRSGYSRGYCTMTSSTANLSLAKPIASPVTTVWVSAQMRQGGQATSDRYFGIGKSGVTGGLFVGAASASSWKLALHKRDAAGNYSQLAAESGTSLQLQALHKYDMLIESFGASGRVRIYLDGGTSPLIDYTGDLTWTGASNLDQFILASCNSPQISEMILADEDTRPMSVVTLYPSAAGDASTVDSGTYAEIDENVINDADIISSGTTGQVFQANLSNLPAGTFTIKTVKEVFRGIRGSTGITKWKHGIKTGGTVNVAQTDTMLTTWDTYDRLMATNPVTTGGWTQSEVDALQIAYESLT